MSLHVETIGHGAPLVMLHGWGMHGGIWHETAAALAGSFTVHVVDLPGHGLSRVSETANGAAADSPFPFAPPFFSLDAVVSELAEQFGEPVQVLGWSLGGIIAQHWALRAPQQVQRLVLVASTPCFAEQADWLCGMPRATLEQFAAELEKNHAATLRRFLALQVRGSEDERELLALLRERLFSRGEPDPHALRGGLEVLRNADLRGELAQIAQPLLAIAGERDKLTPPQASHHIAQAVQNGRVVEIAGAAHAPFLSHANEFVAAVSDFLKVKGT